MSLRSKRWVMLAGSLVFALLCLILPENWASLGAVLMGLLALLGFLYRNLEGLAQVDKDSPKAGVLRQTVIFGAGLVLVTAALVWLSQQGVVEDRTLELLAAVYLCGIMLYIGNVSPKLPFNRYIGLRLPWTVVDEDTWIVAHRLAGYSTLPLVVLYGAAALALPEYFEAASGAVILLWIGIPGVLSAAFYYKKFHYKS